MDWYLVTKIAAWVSMTILTVYGTAIVMMICALFKKTGTKRGSRDNGGLPGVSIVIPFRNEERNLGALLESLKKQSYKGMMEIVLVNDQSEDNGVDAIKDFYHDNDGITIKIIDLQISSDLRLTSKQQALDHGISQSSYPLIALTDADMILMPDWVESLVNTQIATDSGLVFGHTSIILGAAADKRTPRRVAPTLFGLLETYQLEFLFSFAYAFSKLNFIGSCMGNNVLIVKETYQTLGGQRGVGYSIVEDRALLKMMRKNGVKTSASEPFTVTARTYPTQSKRQFASQMMRWAAGGLRPGGGLFSAGLLLLAQNLLLALSIPGFLIALSALPSTTASIPVIIRFAAIMMLAITNFSLTWLFLTLSMKKHRSPAPRKLLYPAYYVFMMIETVIFAAILLFRPTVRWKGRKL